MAYGFLAMVVAAAILASILFPMDRYLPPSYLRLKQYINLYQGTHIQNEDLSRFLQYESTRTSDWSIPNLKYTTASPPKMPHLAKSRQSGAVPSIQTWKASHCPDISSLRGCETGQITS